MGSRLARLSTARHRDKSLLRGTLGSMRVDWGHPYGCILSRKVQNLYRQYRRSVFASAIHKNSKVPIVFCTAYASTKIRADVLKLGNTALTTRPSSRTCWLARLRSAFVTYLNTKGSVTKPWPPPRLCWRGRVPQAPDGLGPCACKGRGEPRAAAAASRYAVRSAVG
jgi:hypothetical protein